MDPTWILIAFALGFAVNRVGLPPLVGYLVAGFVLHAFGAEGGEILDKIGDLGVTLLLFSIGLKLRVKSLTRPEVWAGASLHLLITVATFGIGVYVLSGLRFSVFGALDARHCLLIAFALSFSSTVFAVKVLEERGEMEAFHGRVSIGILIMQDIFAVLFLAASTGKIPSPWALAVPFAMLALRPVLMAVLDRVGHRELVLLFSVFLALGLGVGGFELVGLKGDLGAIAMGMLVAGHPKAKELANSLLSFKDLFLVGFFLSIGMAGTPSVTAVGIAALLTVVVTIKVLFYFAVLTRFKLRARTSLLASFSLANYSEFGLLVCAIGAKNGWISFEWLTIIAIALSMTFILASPLNAAAHSLYKALDHRLRVFETKSRHPDDEPIDPGDASILIFGMGRVGTEAYDFMRSRYGSKVLGLDFNSDVVSMHTESGREVIQADATDPDFWENIRPGKIEMIMLAMQEHSANMYAAERLADINYSGKVTATALFDDQVDELLQIGITAAYNLYDEAGIGFAEHSCAILPECKIE